MFLKKWTVPNPLSVMRETHNRGSIKKEREISQIGLRLLQHASIFRDHRMVWLEGPFNTIQLQLPCCGQRHLPLDHCAQSPSRLALNPSKNRAFCKQQIISLTWHFLTPEYSWGQVWVTTKIFFSAKCSQKRNFAYNKDIH